MPLNRYKNPAMWLIILVALTSCGKWPPHQKEAVKFFYENRAGIEMLRASTIEDDLVEISPGLMDGLYRMAPEHKRQPDFTSEQIKKYKQLLEDSMMYSVWRDREREVIDFDFVQPGDELLMKFVYDPRKNYKARICSSGFKNIGCGICAIKLEESWWLEYRWSRWMENLGDQDLAELTDADIEKYSNECFREGLEIINSYSLER